LVRTVLPSLLRPYEAPDCRPNAQLISGLDQNVLSYFPPETKKKQKCKHHQASTNEIQINIIPTTDNPLTDDHTSRKSIQKLINYLTAPLDASQTQEDQQALVKKWCHGVNKTALTYVTRGLNVYPNDYPQVGKLMLVEHLMT